jgi:hypothetical protein
MRVMAVMAVMTIAACGGGGGNGGGNDAAINDSCSFGKQLAVVGSLGAIDYNATATPPGLTTLTVQLTDYATTCGGTNLPPSYSAQNTWHGVGFQVAAGGMATPLTATYGATGGMPGINACSVSYGLGSGFPTNPVPACAGANYICAPGSTITVMSADANTASGTYDLNLTNDGANPDFSLTGSFSITSNCTSLQ